MDPDETQATGTQAPAVADTAEVTASEASEVKTTEAPEATQTESQGTQTEVTAEDTAETKLYAGKYKTVEDMEKAYKELNSKFTNTATEKAELSRTLNEAMKPPAPADTDDGFQDETTGNQEIEGIKRVQSVQSFIMLHQDADPKAMQEVLQSDPHVQSMTSYDAKLEYAYLRSQNMSRPKAIAEAEKQAANNAVAKVAEKQAAQVETPRATTQTDENSELFAKATGNHDRATRDKARLDWIRKNLV